MAVVCTGAAGRRGGRHRLALRLAGVLALPDQAEALAHSLAGSSAAYGAALGTTSIGAGSQAAMLAAQDDELLADLGVLPKDRELWRRTYAGRARELVAFRVRRLRES